MTSLTRPSTHAARQTLSRLAGPTVGMVVLYCVMFYMPLARTLNERLVKQQKLEEVVRRRAAEHASRAQQAAVLEAEVRSLDAELDATKRLESHLVTRRDQRRAQVLATGSPASLLAETLALLDRHGLACQDSSVVERPAKADADSLGALKPVANLLGATSGEASVRREVRLTLSGPFQQIRDAIGAIGRELRGVFIVSLEMMPDVSAGDPHGSHTWILTIAV